MVKKVQILKTPGCGSCAKAIKLIGAVREEEGLDFEIEELDITRIPEAVKESGFTLGKIKITAIGNVKRDRQQKI